MVWKQLKVRSPVRLKGRWEAIITCSRAVTVRKVSNFGNWIVRGSASS